MTPSICMISAPKHLSPGKEYYPYLPPTAIDPRYPSRRSQRRSEMTVGSQPTRLNPIAPAHPKGVLSRGGGAYTAQGWGGSLPFQVEVFLERGRSACRGGGGRG